MNKELIKKQIKFIGIVLGTVILYYINLWLFSNMVNDLFSNSAVIKIVDAITYTTFGLTVLQVWLVTKYLHK
tara:strand:+ start:1014 stop:1229 length:216 start_codon:yes stop_codon:yes gene_type:complete